LRGRRRRRRRRRQRRRRQSQRVRVPRASLPHISYLVIHIGVLGASHGLLDAAQAEPRFAWGGPQARIKKSS